MAEEREEREALRPLMSAESLYLYCIIRCSKEIIFDGAQAIWDPNLAVYTVPNRGLAAVVSASPVQKYDSTRANMLAHQRVIERVMQEFTVLPVRFGTVTDDLANAIPNIRKLLERRSQEFNALLDEMEGKVELGLKALWRDEKAIFEEIVAERPDIRRLRNSLARKPPAAVHFEGIPLGQMVKEALDRKRDAEAARILAQLRGIALRTVENPSVLDRMIVNSAFLVEKEREEELDRAVRQMDSELGHRVVLRYVGPVPPYNFVNIVVNWEQL